MEEGKGIGADFASRSEHGGAMKSWSITYSLTCALHTNADMV